MDVILLGEIQSLIDGVNTNIANAKSVIDTINNNTKANNTASETGTLSQKLSSIISYTKTNNTASTTGTLSQKISSAISNTAATTTESSSGTLSAKLTYLINRRDRVVIPSGTNLKTFLSNGNLSTTKQNSQSKELKSTQYTTYIKQPGVYRLYATASQTNNTKSYNTVQNISGGHIDSISSADLRLLYSYSGAGNGTERSLQLTSGQDVATTTKTYDMQLDVGDWVKMQFVFNVRAATIKDYCSSTTYYAIDGFTANLTDLSIRGTVIERDGLMS